MPRPYPATPRVAHHFRGHASPVSRDAPRRPPLPRPCLARIPRRPASPTTSEAMPRELFVPAMNERVGMNDRGRPSGSPLRWDTWSFWPDRVGARHCLALIRRCSAAPTFRGIASLTTVSFWDARKGPLRANNSIAGDATGSGSWINIDAARHRFNRTKQPRCGLAATR